MPYLDEEDVSDYTEEIWESFLQMEAKATKEPFSLAKEDYLTGTVVISDAWDGIIVLDCSLFLVRKMAEKLFKHTGKVSTDEERDTLTELTNMIGGNLKARLPQPCDLAFPTVSATGDSHDFPDKELLVQVNFNSYGSEFRVSIYEQKSDDSSDSI